MTADAKTPSWRKLSTLLLARQGVQQFLIVEDTRSLARVVGIAQQIVDTIGAKFPGQNRI